MKKLIFIAVLIIGCDNSTEPKDCAGSAGGMAELDNCNVCDTDKTNDCIPDCNGIWGGDAVADNCATCDADATNDCVQDCAGIWGGDAVSRLVGDIDGDGYITDCCDQPSCQNNPVIENDSCGEKPLGDVSLFVLIYSNGYCSWWPDSTTNISDDYWHNSDLCDNYYWNDFTDNGIIDITDMATFAGNFINFYPDSIPPMPPNTCFKAYIGEECCISN